jgi:hypothetical protein
MSAECSQRYVRGATAHPALAPQLNPSRRFSRSAIRAWPSDHRPTHVIFKAPSVNSEIDSTHGDANGHEEHVRDATLSAALKRSAHLWIPCDLPELLVALRTSRINPLGRPGFSADNRLPGSPPGYPAPLVEWWPFPSLNPLTLRGQPRRFTKLNSVTWATFTLHHQASLVTLTLFFRRIGHASPSQNQFSIRLQA